jgi:uncharacterized protein DUF3455
MRVLIAATLVAVGLTMAVDAAAQTVTPPAVPANLQVDASNTAYLAGHARGSQNYVCVLSPGRGFTWTLFGPQATLFDDGGDQIITHFLSANPVENGALRATWQHSDDTSAVWAKAIQSSTDPSYVAAGAIPWLLLQVVGAQYGPAWGDTLVATTYIQRVDTAGGLAPAAGCTNATDIGKKVFVPYAADYIFYKASTSANWR